MKNILEAPVIVLPGEGVALPVADAIQSGVPRGRMYAPFSGEPDPRRRDVRVYSGEGGTMLSRSVRHRMAGEIHTKLGVENQLGRMHQPPLDDVVQGIEEGGYVLSVQHQPEGPPLLLATSHIRRAKSSPDNRELGGVVKLVGPEVTAGKGQGLIIASEGVWLARAVEGAAAVEALVSQKNPEGQDFFRRVGMPEDARREPIGERPSDYVRDPVTGKRVQMDIFLVTDLEALSHAA